MRLVVDTNVLLSALIADSATRSIILKGGHELYYPELGLAKIRKYKSPIMAKGGLNETEFDYLLKAMLDKIEIVKTEYYESKIVEAKNAMSKVDPEDASYVALALSIPDCTIWSNDKHLHSQKKVPAVSTADLLKH